MKDIAAVLGRRARELGNGDETGGVEAALTQLRAFVSQENPAPNTRLPPERELAEILGVRRSELRKALDVMEDDGQLWRHVGKGTFVGARPIDGVTDLAALAGRTSPSEVMRTRLILEPEIAREAALNASLDDVAAMRRVLRQSRAAETWRQYESCDNSFHRLIAEAARNAVLLALFDAMNVVRRTVAWGRLRPGDARPPASHHSFAEHERIVDAVADRDLDGAVRAMRGHLRAVEEKLLSRGDGG